MKTIQPSRLLSVVLLADAAISAAVAALQVAVPTALSELLNLPAALLLETGLFLCAYVVLLFVMARSRRVPAALVSLIIAGNIGWAIGCLALIVWPSMQPTALGIGFLLLQAVTVSVFAGLQVAGLRRSAPATSAAFAAGH